MLYEKKNMSVHFIFLLCFKVKVFETKRLLLKFAPLVSGIGSLYVARKVAGNGHRDDERGADPEWAPEIWNENGAVNV